MRWLFIILLFPVSCFGQFMMTMGTGTREAGVSATAYYVATDGDNGNAGTFAEPWATWEYGFGQLSSGDTLYIRGGTYTYSDGNGYGIYIDDVDGTASEPVCVFNYPGESPILDFSSFTGDGGSEYGIYLNECENWRIKGLYIKKVGTVEDEYGSGFTADDCDSIYYENCRADSNSGTGFLATTT